jgi:sugar lactone lactonase YvrE
MTGRFNRSLTGTKRRRLSSLFLVLLLISAVVCVGVYVSLFVQTTEDRPAMLRTLIGSPLTLSEGASDWTEASDETSLRAGDRVRITENATAAIQYQGGTISLLTGPAEVTFWGCEVTRRGGAGPEYSIQLDVVSGKVSTELHMSDDSETTFELRAPGSAVAFLEDIVEVDVASSGETSWQVTKGMARLAALTLDSEGDPCVALVTLDSGEQLVTPELPEAWHNDSVTKELMDSVAEIALGATRDAATDVDAPGLELKAHDATTDTALFALTSTADLASADLPTAPTHDVERQLVEDPLLSEAAPWLMVTYAPSIYYTSVPWLPFPKGLTEDEASPEIPTSPPEYLSSIYDVDAPKGVALDKDASRILVTEGEGERQTKAFDVSGNLVMDLAPPNTTASSRLPFYVAVNKLGNIYVTDRIRYTIDIYDSGGDYLGAFLPKGIDPVGWVPLGITFDRAGNLYVTEASEEMHRVLVFDSEGELVLQFGEAGTYPGEFAFPNDIVVDDSGQIYVSDGNNYRVQIFSVQNSSQTVYPYGECQVTLQFILSGSGAGLPRGVAVGPSGCLYVVDTSGHTVRAYDTERAMQSLFQFGHGGVDDGEFDWPEDAAVDTSGKIYVVDKGNNRVQVWAH